MEGSSPTLFSLLIQQRGWTDPHVFARRYASAARELSVAEGPPSLATARVEVRQFNRWLRGDLKGQPRREARRILEHLFRPTPVDALFKPPALSPSVTTGPADSAGAGDAAGMDHAFPGEDMVMAAAEESADFAARFEGSNVGPATLEQLEADIRRIVSTYPNRPVQSLFAEVRRLRNRTFELLEGHQRPDQTVDLYLAAGTLCGVLANASFDLGRYEAAETQARTAFLCGEAAGHNGLRAWVRGLQALMAYWDGRPEAAVRLAEAGSQYVPEHGTAAIRLASIKARSHGQLQQSPEALAALLEADRLRDSVSEDVLPGMMAFPLGKQLYCASTTQLWLGGTAGLSNAEAMAEQAVADFNSAPAGQVRLGELSLARMDLAVARMGRGDLEGAAIEVHEVIQVNGQRRIESVRKRLGQFGRQLTAHPGGHSPMGIGLREALISHQERLARELPPGGPT
ncbi:tetratricopeptide repeat protein [Streptomyces yaizuensis]|uniref:Helix-turn-helix domain-containing protein n=1 Tax=Streptomyces yaizuensis TaxID=2989713 RepID=A0ABQ5NYS6_9ACTN|nr:hypothetical protein [Streptomyces sp. YSPA8]GLF95515.1 helix-turn-helix domain-containing protein [Streptomyces sp. YSPA8]